MFQTQDYSGKMPGWFELSVKRVFAYEVEDGGQMDFEFGVINEVILIGQSQEVIEFTWNNKKISLTPES